MSFKSRLKYGFRRPKILGGKRFHPKNGELSTRRYESYGNRFRRSHKLPVRLGGGGGVQLCGGGSCVENTQYGSAGQIKELIYQFPSQPPISVFTNQDWIKFVITQSTVYGTIAGASYAVRVSANWRVLLRQGSLCNEYSHSDFDGSRLFGPVTVSDPYVLRVDNNLCADLYTYAYTLTHHGRQSFSYSCSTGSGSYNPNQITETITWEYLGLYGYAIPDSLTQTVEWMRCPSAVTTPDPQGLTITISDPTGVIHTGVGVSGNLTHPSVTINQGDAGDGFKVQSSKYPQVWYEVPSDHSTCNCGDRQKYTPAPNIPINEYRDWRGSQAGSFNPCKHQMAVRRVLGITQAFADYVPYDDDSTPFVDFRG